MPSHVLLVLANAVSDKEEEFNRWYDDQHLPDVLKVPGIVSAQRFKYAGPAGGSLEGPHPEPQYQYISLYEVETDDPQKVQADMISRIGTDKMIMTDAMDFANSAGNYYAPITPKRTS